MGRKIVLLSLVTLFLAGCCGMFPPDVEECLPWSRTPPRQDIRTCADGQIYNQIMHQVARTQTKFAHERRLKLENSLVYYDGCVTKIRLDFSTMALLELCEARELLVDIVEDFLKRINSDSIITSRLCDRYLTPDHLQIEIDFKSWMGKLMDLDYIGWVSLKGGCASYYAFDMRTNQLDWWHRRSESYPESRAVVINMREAEKEWQEQQKIAPSALDDERYIFSPTK